jgi:hypothetical protein
MTVAIGALILSGLVAVVAVQIGPAERTYQRSADASFASLVTPIALETNGTGAELTSMLVGSGAKLTSSTLMATLDSMVGDANDVVDQFEDLQPPKALASAAAACLSALRGRAMALARFRSAVADQLDAPTATAATAIEGLGSVLLDADRSWSKCRSELVSAPGTDENEVPESAWIGSASLWGATSVTSFLSTVSESSPSPAGQGDGTLSIVTVSASPPAEVSVDGSDVLPDTTSVTLHVVVADRSTVADPHVVVEVTVTPTKGSGTPVSSSASGPLGAGLSVSFHPPGLHVEPGMTYTLEVTAKANQSGASARRSYRISIEAPSGVAQS